MGGDQLSGRKIHARQAFKLSLEGSQLLLLMLEWEQEVGAIETSYARHTQASKALPIIRPFERHEVMTVIPSCCF